MQPLVPNLLQGLRPLRAKFTRRLQRAPSVTGNPWHALQQELDRWHRDGRTAHFWWRDDDATEPTDPIRRLLALRRKTGVPIALAVIPATATDDLRALVLEQRSPTKVSILQHGYRHEDYAKSRRIKAELGRDRPVAIICDELAAGRKVLEGWQGWQPVLVPPFNRIALRLVRRIAMLGYVGLSTNGDRRDTPQAPGITQVNAHIDVLAWDTPQPCFAGTERCLTDAIAHLRAKRLGKADSGEATGLMTHCWAHDEATWDFCQEFITRTTTHAAARWISTRTAFGISA